MKRNITPFYIDGPVEEVDCSLGDQTISGKSSFVLLTGAPDGSEGNTIPTVLYLPTRTSDDRPVIPGTMVTVVRTSTNPISVLVGSTNMLNINVTSSLTANLDSASFMFVGPSSNNVFGAWTLVSSDLIWNGGTVTQNATFSNSVYLNGLTRIGNSTVNDLQIASNFRFSASNNNPTIAFNTAGSGTATLNDSAHPNAAIISFSGIWASGDTAVITLPTGVTFEAERFILKNQASTINGNIAVTGDAEITFTATGTCVGDLGYLVIVMGS